MSVLDSVWFRALLIAGSLLGLSLNVIVPADTDPSAKLPVVVVSSSYGVMDSSVLRMS